MASREYLTLIGSKLDQSDCDRPQHAGNERSAPAEVHAGKPYGSVDRANDVDPKIPDVVFFVHAHLSVAFNHLLRRGSLHFFGDPV